MTNTKKNLPGRHAKISDDLRAEAVRLVQTRGHPLRALADDLGVGHSTLGKWVSAHKEADLLSGPHDDTAKELARHRYGVRPSLRSTKRVSFPGPVHHAERLAVRVCHEDVA